MHIYIYICIYIQFMHIYIYIYICIEMYAPVNLVVDHCTPFRGAPVKLQHTQKKIVEFENEK